ncbi:hypothetical protein [Microbaculum marinum]|uniref:Secreted protein n=1 Tax=Microbaculum marinum TaxID=1764581 RepID=A0AAW9RUN5_9HYPH
MSTSMTRRAAVTGLAAAPVALVAVPTPAPAALPAVASVGDDAALFDLFNKWREIGAKADQVGEAEDALVQQIHADAAVMPDALRWRDGDASLCLDDHSAGARFRGHYTEKDVERLRGPRRRARTLVRNNQSHPEAPMAIRHDVEPVTALTNPGYLVELVQEPWPEAQARADELVAAFACWDQTPHPLQARCDELGREWDRLCDRRAEIEDQIANTPAKTLPGIMAKVVFVIKRMETDSLADQDIAESTLRDMHAMFGGAS